MRPPGPRRYNPTPLDGHELHVHPQRAGALDPAEKRLVALFLQCYVVCCGRTSRIDRMRNAAELLAELAGQYRRRAINQAVEQEERR